MNGPFGGPPAIFTLVPVFIGIIFVIVIGSIVVNVIKGVAQWSSNNAQPEVSAAARVAAKRTEVNGGRNNTSTDYFVTFELPSGERREFSIHGHEYGLLSEGDAGVLRHQGTRYLGFEREASALAAAEPPPAPEPGPNLVCAYCGAVNPPDALKCTGCGSGKLTPASPPVETA